MDRAKTPEAWLLAFIGSKNLRSSVVYHRSHINIDLRQQPGVDAPSYRGRAFRFADAVAALRDGTCYGADGQWENPRPTDCSNSLSDSAIQKALFDAGTEGMVAKDRDALLELAERVRRA